MKKTLFFTLLTFAAVGFMSCDEKEELQTTDSGIVGTWEGDPNSHHCPVVTFGKDGSYEWEWTGVSGFKDEGNYTYEGSKIEMDPSTYYEWNEEKNKYVKSEPWDTKNRVCIISYLDDGLMKFNLKQDYLMGDGQGEGFDFILYRAGLNQKITANDLQGTWESYDEDGNIDERIIVKGNNFTSYSAWNWDEDTISVMKTQGTWSLKDGFVTFTPTDGWYSYSTEYNDKHETVWIYSYVDRVTLEAEDWSKTHYTPSEYEQKIYLSKDGKLFAGGKAFEKKK